MAMQSNVLKFNAILMHRTPLFLVALFLLKCLFLKLKELKNDDCITPIITEKKQSVHSFLESLFMTSRKEYKTRNSIEHIKQ